MTDDDETALVLAHLNEASDVHHLADALGGPDMLDLAERRLANRAEIGRFASMKDVGAAPGIGRKRIEVITDRLGKEFIGGDLRVRREGEALARRRAWLDTWFDVSGCSEITKRVDEGRRRRPRQRATVREAANLIDRADRDRRVALVGHRVEAEVGVGENPAERDSWGRTGVYARVDSKEAFRDAGLVIRLEDRETAHLREETITVDPNHPLAGETLHFEVTVESLRDATEEEIAHGHPHGPGGHHH